MPTKTSKFVGEWLESRDMQRRLRSSRAVNAESSFVQLTFEFRQRTKVDSLSSRCCSMYSAIETFTLLCM